MRAFKHITKSQEAELLSVFPSAWDFEWQDDESFIKIPFSFWDKWLCETSDNPANELWNVPPSESQRRTKVFCDLAKALINNHKCYGLFFRQNRLKAVRSSRQLIEDVDREQELRRPLFIPECASIYTQGHDYTGWLHTSNIKLAEPILRLIKSHDLKLIE